MQAGFLETLNVQVRDGRLPDDDTSPLGLEPVVLTASAAHRLFSDRRAVAQTIPLRGRSGEVVAVVDDVAWGFDHDPLWIYIVPHASNRFGAIVARTRGETADVLNSIRQAVVAETPPRIPVSATWLTDSIGTHTAYRSPRFQTVVFGGFGLLAIGLAILGVFAIVAATTALRTRELGIRLAIGASPQALVRATVLETAIPIVIGVLCGAATARIAAKVARAHVTDLAVPGFEVMLFTVATVICAGLVAAYLPARRAARVDPIVVLRAE